MRIQLSRAGITAFALASALSAQTIVSGGGTAMQLAINAASLGDTLLVQAGDYFPITIDFGLTVICEPGARFLNTPADPSVNILSLPVGQTVRWFGGEMAAAQPNGEFRVFFCDGVVAAEGILSENCIVNDSPQTSFTNCVFTERTLVDRSTVTFTSCTLQRHQFCAGATCSSLEIQDGTATLVDSTVIGPPGLAPIFPASAGIYINVGTVRLAGPGTSVSSGGNPIIPPIVVNGGFGSIEMDPAVLVNGTPSGAAPTVMTIPSTATTGGASGAVVPFTSYSEVGSLSVTLVGLLSPRLPTPFGEVWLMPPAITVLVGVVPANGSLSGSIVVPATAYAQAVTFHNVALLTGGNLVIGPPTVAIYR